MLSPNSCYKTCPHHCLAPISVRILLPKQPMSHACIGLFNSHGLFTDMLAHPQLYLNGTVPPNVTGAINACVVPLNQPSSCTVVTGSARDSYLWWVSAFRHGFRFIGNFSRWDELHPSEQADRVIAREIVAAIRGTSGRWITWFS